MKSVSFYHRETGLFNGTHLIVSDDAAVALNTPTDHIAIDGQHDHLSKCVNVETQGVIDYQPPEPSSDHEWNVEKKRWVLGAKAQELRNRQAVARSRITVLETSQARAIRESILGPGSEQYAEAKRRLQEIENEIQQLRNDL